MVSGMGIEERLLLNCTRWALAPTWKLEIETSDGEKSIDWDKLLEIATEHRVIPLLYRAVQSLTPNKVPLEIADRLTAYMQRKTRDNLRLSRELINILELCQKEQILAVPFKGACLSLLAYGNIADRDFSDLDILLHRADVPKAIELLSRHRYRDRYQLTPDQQAERWERHHEWDLIKDNDLVGLDLHWGFTERPIYFPLDLAALQARLQPLSFFGREFWTFSVTDTLLILCVNGSKEQWCRLSRICDIAALISRHPDLNWEEVLQTATQLGSRRMLFLGSILARELMGIALPESISKAIATDIPGQLLAQRLQERLFSGSDRPLAQVETARYYLEMRERWRDRLWYAYYYFRYSGSFTPSSRDREWMALPPRLNFIYYFVRPLRVLSKYGAKIVKERSPN